MLRVTAVHRSTVEVHDGRSRARRPRAAAPCPRACRRGHGARGGRLGARRARRARRNVDRRAHPAVFAHRAAGRRRARPPGREQRRYRAARDGPRRRLQSAAARALPGPGPQRCDRARRRAHEGGRRRIDRRRTGRAPGIARRAHPRSRRGLRRERARPGGRARARGLPRPRTDAGAAGLVRRRQVDVDQHAAGCRGSGHRRRAARTTAAASTRRRRGRCIGCRGARA